MALLQALFSFIGKSAGKILTAMFGWAVVALFGQTSPKEHTLLSGLVAAAAAWPDEQPLTGLSTAELVAQLTQQSTDLVKKQVALAQSELRLDIKREVTAFAGFGIAGACAFATFILLLVAAVFALAEEMSGWQASLIVSAAVLVLGGVAALFGWSKRVKTPLGLTQKTLKEDAQWAKERLT